MDLPSYNQSLYWGVNYNNLNFNDLVTSARYNRDALQNYITISSFTHFPNNKHRLLLYDYGKLLNVNLMKYPKLMKYVLTAILEKTPEDWNEIIDDNGCIYYQNKILYETSRVHPMTKYYYDLIQEKKKRIKKKSCTIM